MPSEKRRSGERRIQSVLVFSTEPGRAKIASTALAADGRGCRMASSLEELGATGRGALIVVLLPLTGASAGDVMSAVGPDARVVLCGSDSMVSGAVDALHLGALAHAPDPSTDPFRFREQISSSIDRDTDVEKDAVDWGRILGTSPAMERVRTIVQQVCARSRRGAAPTILLSGETGTGKGLLASAIHFHGGRKHEPFVDVNCAAIPASLIESELFGHERGAFTDAREARVGLFQSAHGGTLFLDEIAALPLDLQAKILTVIEEKRVRPVGARQAATVDVQLMAATHRELKRMVESGEFRADLFHRLNVVSIRIPPLRERGDDKLHIAERLLSSMCGEFGIPPRRLAPSARDRIVNHGWPGNVRELRNKLERILMLEDSDVIEAWHFDGDGPPSIRVVYENGDIRVRLPPEGIQFSRLEREVLREALALNHGNVTRAARYLGITRQTLMYRMKKHGLLRG
jgi:DNA-binding NtrC family response regulator